jgi:GTP-binding protein
VDKIFELINSCYEQASRRITTGLLNDMLAEATARVQPPTDKAEG